MALSIDVTSSGLDAGPDYFNNTGQQPPSVTVVNDGGRYGFDVSDTVGVTLPQTALVDSFFNANEFSASLSFMAQDGANSAGKLFRIHQALHVQINANGSLRVDFINDSNTWTTINTAATTALDGNWHDLLISYDGTAGQLQVSLDSTLLASKAASGNTKSNGPWGLTFGEVFGITGFDGLIDDFQIDDVATAPPPPPPPPGPFDTLTIDVDANGLVGDAAYDDNVSQPLPNVTAAQEDGRWGFDLDDGTQVGISKEALDGPFFAQSAFNVSFSMKAQDGANSAGEVFRAHNNLEMRVQNDGSFRVDFINDLGARFTLYSNATNVLDGEWHDIAVSYDDAAGQLELYLDDFAIASRAASGSTHAMQHWGLNFGSAWGSTAFDGLIDDVTVTNSANAPEPPPPAPITELLIDFESGAPPGMSLFGDAFVNKNAGASIAAHQPDAKSDEPNDTVGTLTNGTATLNLDGIQDYALIASLPQWQDATQVTASVDFRFDDPGDLDYARPLYIDGAFGFDAKGDALNVMVQTATGEQRIYLGNQSFDDLQWHSLGIEMNSETDQLTVTVDGQTIVDRSDLDLVLPQNFNAIQLGGTSWGRWLPGEIDNVSISAGTPDALTPATGVADPTVAYNTGAYSKWGSYPHVPFIDRMKGAHEWEGSFKRYYQSEGSVHVFNDTGVFSGNGNVANLTFTPETILNINQVVSTARYVDNIINNSQFWTIFSNPNAYFKIQTDGNGHSQLAGRLFTSDPFEVMAQFDSDIGMNMDQLRAAGQARIPWSDRDADFNDIPLDENGWPISGPVDVAGDEGSATSIVMWYPTNAATAPDNIYFGNYYLMADGEGSIGINHSGGGGYNTTGIQIDGPTVVPFTYNPNGGRITLTIENSDPNDAGEYIRNIRIVHEDHMELFEAGEIFTPEFVEFHQDDRVLRWMDALEINDNPPHAEGAFEDGPDLDYYSYNLGTTVADLNGFPIDGIVAFSNKTGVDPWINVPVNATDAYIQEMAEYIEANLAPRLKAHIELGNEIWNSGFDTYHYARAEGLARWGELQLQVDGGGQFVRDGGGNLIVLQPGLFFSTGSASANGYNLSTLAAELNLGHGLYDKSKAWAEWQGARATEVAEIFDSVFTAADPLTADAGLEHVVGTQGSSNGNTPIILNAAAWADAEPGSWSDPATVLETLSVNAYFGHSAGSRDSDIVAHWLNTGTQQEAQDMLVRHMSAGLDPNLNHIAFDGGLIDGNGNVDANQVITGVTYAPDLIVDVFDAIFDNNTSVQNKIWGDVGVSTGAEVLFGSDVHNYVRLVTEVSGNTALQLRVDPVGGQFETVLEFDSLLTKTIDQLIDEGTLFVRRMESMADSMENRMATQKAHADNFGLNFNSYEAGQHFVTVSSGPYWPNANKPELTDLFIALNESPDIGLLYDLWLEAWQDLGAGPIAQYVDYSGFSVFGSWGALEYVGQQDEAGAITPKYDAIAALNNQAPWWTTDARDPGTFLQGITDFGTTGPDTINGTVEEDLLFGNDGDDNLVGGPGNDALSGGLGTNTISAGDGDDLILISSLTDTIRVSC